MLREFSLRRVIGFFLIDWLGSLAMLFVAGSLRARIGVLPAALTQTLQELEIQVGGAGGAAPALSNVPAPVYLLAALIWPLVFVSLTIYDSRRSSTLRAEMLNVFVAICVSAITLSGVLFLTYRETSRLIMVLFVSLDITLLEGSRLGLWLYRRRRKGDDQARPRVVMVVGAGLVGQNVVQQLQRFGWADCDVVGYLDDDPAKQNQLLRGLPVLGMLEQATQVVQERRVQHAVVALPPRAHERLVTICQTLQKLGVFVHVVPDLFALSFPSASLDGFGGIPVIHLGQAGIYGWQRAGKRIFDLLAVSLGLALIWPLLGLIALLIRLDSKGPVFYRQKRIGQHGRSFTMLKFRSMQVDADPALHQAHVARLIVENLKPEQLDGGKLGNLKLEGDPRITRVGRVIRKLSLDELPQLFNVLKGEMSLVGPRPPLPYELDMHQEWHKRRLDVLPGITGLWQVKGRNQVSFDEMVRMDLEYIQRQSLWLDFKILLQTPWALIHTRGAG